MDTTKIALRDLNADWLRALSWDLPFETAEDAADMVELFSHELIWEMVENEIPSGLPMPDELREELRSILPPRDQTEPAADDDDELAEMAASTGNWPAASMATSPHAATGIMMALVPDETHALLEVADGFETFEPSDLHLTLGYFGDTTDDDAPDTGQIIAAIYDQFEDLREPIVAEATAAASFGEDGESVVLEVPSETILTIRQQFVDALKAQGLAPDDKYEYRPHITLGEFGPVEDGPLDEPVTVTFSVVRVAAGPEVRDLVIGTPLIQQSEAAISEMAGRDIGHVPRDFYGRWTRRRDLPGPPGEAISDRYERVRETVLNPDVANTYRTDITEKDENGNWTSERTALHDQIVDEFMSAHGHIPKEGRAIIMGGLGGAGKTTLLRNNPDAADALGLDLDERGNPRNFLVVNADDFKGKLHDRGMIPEVDGLLPGEAAVFVHEEASWISRRVADRAQADGTNLVWDYTMGSSDSAETRIAPLTDDIGPVYEDIRVVFVDVSGDHSIASARKRWEGGIERDPTGFGGRFVPDDFIRAAADTPTENRSFNRDAFDEVKDKDWVNGWMLWDNEGYDSKLIDSNMVPS